MKVRAYRFTASTVLVLSFFGLMFSADKICFLLAGKQQEILFDYSFYLPLVLDTAAVIFILFFFKRYDYSRFSKKGLAIALTAVVILAVLPLCCLAGRTEITPDSVVRHRIFRSPVTYDVSDCENVTVYFRINQPYRYRSGLGDPYLALDYEMTFSDGYTVSLSAEADETWWTVTEKLNDKIEKSGIKKTVYAADRTLFTDEQWWDYGLENGMVGKEDIIDRLCREAPE